MTFSKEKKERFVLVINTVLFFAGAIDYYNKDSITLFIVLIITGLVNFSLVFFRRNEDKSRLNLFVFFMNSMIAFLVARDYFLGGSNYIHYAWIAAGIVYLGATFVLYRKNKIVKA